MDTLEQSNEILEICNYLKDKDYTFDYYGRVGLLVTASSEPHITATKEDVKIRISVPDMVTTEVFKTLMMGAVSLGIKERSTGTTAGG